MNRAFLIAQSMDESFVNSLDQFKLFFDLNNDLKLITLDYLNAAIAQLKPLPELIIPASLKRKEKYVPNYHNECSLHALRYSSLEIFREAHKSQHSLQ